MMDEKTHGWDGRTMSFSEFLVLGESDFLKSVEFVEAIIFLFV
jgi:hypothetical protein